MPIRRSTSSVPSPRPKRAAPPRASRHAVEPSLTEPHVEMTSRLLSHEEKHELIRAHAHARHIRQPQKQHVAGYYVAIAASCLLVVAGWIFTLDRNIHQNIATTTEPDAFLAGIGESTDQFVQQASTDVERLKETTKAIKAQQQAEKEAIEQKQAEVLKEIVEEGTTPTPSLVP